jgi:hypothetical protein
MFDFFRHDKCPPSFPFCFRPFCPPLCGCGLLFYEN